MKHTGLTEFIEEQLNLENSGNKRAAQSKNLLRRTNSTEENVRTGHDKMKCALKRLLVKRKETVYKDIHIRLIKTAVYQDFEVQQQRLITTAIHEYAKREGNTPTIT